MKTGKSLLAPIVGASNDFVFLEASMAEQQAFHPGVSLAGAVDLEALKYSPRFLTKDEQIAERIPGTFG